jgi:hypothetical protein
MEPGPEAPRWLAIGLALLLGGGALVGFGLLRPRLVGRARVARRRARALGRLGALPRATPIAAGVDGTVRVRGRVKLLRAVRGPVDGAPLAAVETHDEREGGRFAVVDETSVAVVDDDCFELWSTDLARAGGRLADGAAVEVLGRARWAPATDVAGLAADVHYRSGANALVFDGTPDEPIVILAD